MAANETALVAPAKDVRNLIMSDAFQQQIKKAMPAAMSSDVMLRVAVTTIQKTPKLLECSRESLMQCVLECAQLGLLPDGILGQAYMVPYSKVATLQIGYRGILELARRSNQVKFVVGEAVYDCDKFKISYAPVRTMSHDPDIDNPDRGRKEDGKYLPIGFRGAYGLVVYKDDTIDFEYLPLHKIERVRAGSQTGSSKDGPWLNHFEEMAKKTGIRSLGKRLPLSADDLRMLVRDEYNEQGIDLDYSVDPAIASLARDEEMESLFTLLTWNTQKRKVYRESHAAKTRDEQLVHLRGIAISAGLLQEGPKEPAEGPKIVRAETKPAAESETTKDSVTEAKPAAAAIAVDDNF